MANSPSYGALVDSHKNTYSHAIPEYYDTMNRKNIALTNHLYEDNHHLLNKHDEIMKDTSRHWGEIETSDSLILFIIL